MDELTEPHFADSALLTIDMQFDTFDGGPLEVRGTTAIIPEVARLCSAYRDAGLPIVHLVRLYLPDGSNADRSRRALVRDRGPLLAPGTPGRALPAALFGGRTVELDDEALLANTVQLVGAGEVIIFKPRWGAFFQSALEAHLAPLGVDTLVFCGCNYPNCPRTSIYEASERDYRVAVVADAISGLYERGRSEMEGIGVALVGVDEVLDEIGATSLPRSAAE